MDEEGLIHDEIEIEDFEYDEEDENFTYPCPCGDIFVIAKEDLLKGQDIARCQSCSLIIRVIYDENCVDKYFILARNKNKQFEIN